MLTGCWASSVRLCISGHSLHPHPPSSSAVCACSPLVSPPSSLPPPTPCQLGFQTPRLPDLFLLAPPQVFICVIRSQNSFPPPVRISTGPQRPGACHCPQRTECFILSRTHPACLRLLWLLRSGRHGGSYTFQQTHLLPAGETASFSASSLAARMEAGPALRGDLPCKAQDADPQLQELLEKARLLLCALSRSGVSDSSTPWTAASQAPLSLGILQVRIPEWVAYPFSRGSS